jgi:hypothetical protein
MASVSRLYTGDERQISSREGIISPDLLKRNEPYPRDRILYVPVPLIVLKLIDEKIDSTFLLFY